MKTPISYYGGKQSMLKHILPMIPEHHVYVEPFFGGGAVFFAKEPVKTEIINDFNANVTNFYKVLKSDFNLLKFAIEETIYSRATYKRAMTIYECPWLFNDIQRAWAFWVCTTQGFSNQIGSWRGASNRPKEAILNTNKKKQITPELADRLKYTIIEENDVIAIIKKHDSKDTFFYVDPPYVGANQGHYGGYTQEHFDNLLEVLSAIKGKFLLSSYPNDALNKYREQCGWSDNDQTMVNYSSQNSSKRKTECLTFNYD